MKVQITRNALLKELALIQGVVERKATIPALSMLLAEASKDGTLKLTATDLDNTIIVETDAVVSEPGELCINARKLFEIARLLPEGEVNISSSKNDWAIVQSGEFSSRLQGTAKDKFPEPQSGRFDALRIAPALFRRLVASVTYAISMEESRYTLAGAKVEFNNSGLRMIATDGHRLAFVSRSDIKPNGSGRELDILIPKKALAEASKLADGFDGEMEIGTDGLTVAFKVGRRMLVSRTLNGQFPNYEMVIPKNNTIGITVETEPLALALRRVGVMADQRSNSGAFGFKDNVLALQAASSEDGEAFEELPIDYSGEEIKIGFNLEYVREGLNAMGASRVKWEIKDSNSQVLIRPETAADETENLLTIIMPMRL